MRRILCGSFYVNINNSTWHYLQISMFVCTRSLRERNQLHCRLFTVPRLYELHIFSYYSAPAGERSNGILRSVCLCVCLSVHEHISGTAKPIFIKFFVQIPYGLGSVLFWRRSDVLSTSGFMDDVTFGRNGPYGGRCDTGRSLMSTNALF